MNTAIKYISFLLVILVTSNLYSQEIENVKAMQSNNKIVVYYKLGSAKFNQTFRVSLYYSTDNGKTYVGPLQKVTGDVGEGISRGANKKINWNLFDEGVMFDPKDKVIFRVDAVVIDEVLKRNFYISYLGNDNTPLGASIGLIGKMGFYISARKNMDESMETTYEYSNYQVQHYNLPYYYEINTHPGSVSIPEYAITGGITYQVRKNFFLYLGGGYYNKEVYWQLINYEYETDLQVSDSYVRHADHSRRGIMFETGLIYRFARHIVISGGATIELNYINYTAGIGLCF